MCALTLELSGGGAVRLERIVRDHRRIRALEPTTPGILFLRIYAWSLAFAETRIFARVRAIRPIRPGIAVVATCDAPDVAPGGKIVMLGSELYLLRMSALTCSDSIVPWYVP